MAGALPVFRQGPATYTVAGLILGGQLVVPNAATGDSTVKVCPTGGPVSGTFPLGIAATDSNNTNPEGTPSLPGAWAGDGSSTVQDQLLEQSALLNTVAVYNNVDMVVNYDGAANFGAALTWSSTTAGALAATNSTDPKVIIGKCTQPGGVAAAGPGRAFIKA